MGKPLLAKNDEILEKPDRRALSALWAVPLAVLISRSVGGAEPPRGGGRAGVLKNRKQKTEGGQGPHYD